MRREVHVRFCERLAVTFRGPTLLRAFESPLVHQNSKDLRLIWKAPRSSFSPSNNGVPAKVALASKSQPPSNASRPKCRLSESDLKRIAETASCASSIHSSSLTIRASH